MRNPVEGVEAEQTNGPEPALARAVSFLGDLSQHVLHTHDGEFLGLRPTDRKVEYEAIDISRIVDGKMVEHWGIPDYLTLFRQLGIRAI